MWKKSGIYYVFVRRIPLVTTRTRRWASSGSVLMSRFGYQACHFDVENANHQASLQYALHDGVKLIVVNTASMESLDGVGVVLAGMENQKLIQRAQVEIHCKVGDIISPRSGTPPNYAECVKLSAQNCYHSLSPSYLQEAITSSCEKLRTPYLDTVLLTVMFQFGDHRLTLPKESDRPKYIKQLHDRLKRAFQQLEIEVKQGRIRKYGVASDNFTVVDFNGKNSTGILNLQDLLTLAKEVEGSSHHFRCVHLPLNLNESQFYLNCAPDDLTCSFIRWARNQGFYVVADRPLQTYDLTTGDLNRYVDTTSPPQPPSPCSSPSSSPSSSTSPPTPTLTPPNPSGATPVTDASDSPVSELLARFNRSLNAVIHLERKLDQSFRSQTTEKPPPKHWHSFGHYLAAPNSPQQRVKNWYVFQKLAIEQVRPIINALAQNIRARNNDELMECFRVYRASMEQLLESYSCLLLHQLQQETAAVKNSIGKLCPELSTSPTLAQKAVRVVCNTPVHAVVIGMKHPVYYKELIALHQHLHQTPLDPMKVFELMSSSKVKFASEKSK